MATEHSRPANHRPKKTATLLAQRIVSEISEESLVPGTPLRSERAMLDHYRVSRGSLREALRYLEIQGVISIKTGPGGGAVVAEPASRHVAGSMAMFLQLEHAHFRDVLEARAELEPVLARHAAERIDDSRREELRGSVRGMREQLDDIETFLHQNEVFHSIIATAAGNSVFALVIASLNWIVDGTPLGVEYPARVRRSVVREHHRIYEAIAAGNGDAAAAAMRVHIGDFEAYLRRFYPSLVDAPLRWDQLG